MSTSSTSSAYSNLPTSTQQALAAAGGTSSPLQISGLASGLNTTQIIDELVDIAGAPVVNMNAQQSGLKTLNSTLTSIQTSLQAVALDAQALTDPTLFLNTQSASSSDSTRVTATTAGGAPIGSYSVNVSQLANAATKTFSFTSPAAADTLSIDGQPLNLAAGASATDLINAVNSNPKLDVYAATNNAGQVVLSSRSTGQQTGSYIQVSDPGGALTEDPTQAYAGQNAEYTINGVAGTPSASDTITNAIPGVNLTLGGVTTSSNPVTVTVSPPAPNTASITAAVNTFVQDYNSVLSTIQSQLSTAPTSGTSSATSLFGDSEFENLLSDMRTANYTPGAGLPPGMASLADIGISTGAASGDAPTSQATLSGQLTVNATTLANAIATNPTGVRAILSSWSQSFSNIVNNEAAPGGAIDSRISGDNQEITDLGNQISDQNNMLVIKQQQLSQEYTALETAMSQSSSQSSWLTGQTASIAANSAASAAASSGH